MSRSLASFNSSTRCLYSLPSGSVLAPPRTSSGVLRRSMHLSHQSRQALAHHNNVSHAPPLSAAAIRHGHTAVQRQPQFGLREDDALTVGTTVDGEIVDGSSSQGQDEVSRFSRHLNEQFAPLNFPSELARRILTHGSHAKAPMDGHNARLAFVGRRVLHTYTSLFLHSSSACDPSHDHDFIVERTLNTYALGQYVAPHMYLGRIVRWHPTVNPEISARAQFKYADVTKGAREVDPELTAAIQSHPTVMRSVGLYKVMGEAVQALMGGTYHQFGGTVALRLFHTRILPHLLLTGPLGLHPAYHADAYNKAKEMSVEGLIPQQATN